jgi:Outer membrane protein beta-barrel domain
MFRLLVVSLGLAAFAGGPLAAQDFEIGPRLGYVKWKEVTGLENAVMIGLDATYRISSRLGIGARLDFARPSTDEQYFASEQTFGDSTFVFAVKQPVTILQYGVQALAETGGALSVFAKGGAGGYTITLDPQTARGRVSTTDWGFNVGGGVRLRTGGGTSVSLEVQDIIYTNYVREALNPVEPRFRPVRFPDVVPTLPEFEGTAHNLYAAITFLFTPGGAR